MKGWQNPSNELLFTTPQSLSKCQRTVQVYLVLVAAPSGTCEDAESLKYSLLLSVFAHVKNESNALVRSQISALAMREYRATDAVKAIRTSCRTLMTGRERCHCSDGRHGRRSQRVAGHGPLDMVGPAVQKSDFGVRIRWHSRHVIVTKDRLFFAKQGLKKCDAAGLLIHDPPQQASLLTRIVDC